MRITKTFILLIPVLFSLAGIPALAQTEFSSRAESVYSQFHESIVQIRIVEINSGSQSSLGTGFFIGDGSRMATNYHVVSSVAMEPEKYKVEIEYLGEKHNLELLSVDAINDLAVLRSPVRGDPLELADRPPPNGSTLYSIGNPFDLGMTLVEGNYNGLVADRFFDQIHFSGAINSGMSGGPTLSESGEVIGVNVASAGNQVGFLVPVRFLRELEEKIVQNNGQPTDLHRDIRNQVNQATTFMINELLSREWPKETIGNARVIGQIHNAVECWGESDNDEEYRLNQISKGCKNQEIIYLDHTFYTGFIEYEFQYVKANDWPASALYRRMSSQLGSAQPGNSGDKDYVGNFECTDNNVHIDMLEFKAAYCVRAYKKFHALYDVLYISASIDKTDEAFITHFTLSGVSRENAQAFLSKFISETSWQ